MLSRTKPHNRLDGICSAAITTEVPKHKSFGDCFNRKQQIIALSAAVPAPPGGTSRLAHHRQLRPPPVAAWPKSCCGCNYKPRLLHCWPIFFLSVVSMMHGYLPRCMSRNGKRIKKVVEVRTVPSTLTPTILQTLPTQVQYSMDMVQLLRGPDHGRDKSKPLDRVRHGKRIPKCSYIAMSTPVLWKQRDILTACTLGDVACTLM